MTNDRMLKKRSDIRGARTKFIILILIFLILLAVSLYLHFTDFDIKDIKNLKNSPVLFILIYIAVSFVPIPFAPTTFAAAVFYPVFQAIIYTLIGNTIFTTIMFLITRYLGKDYVDYLIKDNKKYNKFEKNFEKRAFLNIFMMRVFFIIPGEVISVFCGLSKVRFKTYFLATLVGNIPLIVFTSVLIRTIIRDNYFWMIISLFALMIMLVIPFFTVPEIRNYIKNKLKK